MVLKKIVHIIHRNGFYLFNTIRINRYDNVWCSFSYKWLKSNHHSKFEILCQINKICIFTASLTKRFLSIWHLQFSLKQFYLNESIICVLNHMLKYPKLPFLSHSHLLNEAAHICSLLSVSDHHWGQAELTFLLPWN